MKDRGVEGLGQTADQGRRLMDTARDVAERAGSYAQTHVSRLSDRATDVAGEFAEDAREQLERFTGRNLDAWTSDAAALSLLTLATPASAFVVEVTTSVAVSESDDQATIKSAVQSAVDGVLKEAIAFTPTMVMLTRALVVGERLYIRLLIADQEGEKTFKDLAEPDDEAAGSASPRLEL